MLFYVKTEVPKNKVDEFTERVANHRVRTVEGNMSWVTTDGSLGFDIVDCANEAECPRKYADLEKNGLRIVELTEVAEMGQFLNMWKRRHQKAA